MISRANWPWSEHSRPPSKAVPTSRLTSCPYNRLGHPDESRDVYRFLVEAGYFDAEFGEAMMAMVAFRNRIVHLYWELDVERLYRYLQEDIPLLRRFRDLVLQILTVEEEPQQDDKPDHK